MNANTQTAPMAAPKIADATARDRGTIMFGLSASDALRIVNEIRIWAMIGSAIAAVFAMGAGWAQVRLQATVGKEKDAALERYKAVAETRTLELRNDAKKLEIQLEKERAERLRLEKKMQPRELTDEHKEAISEIFKHYAGVRVFVTSMMNDKESNDVANSFVDVIKLATGRFVYPPMQAILKKPHSGINIQINDKDAGREDILELANLLSAVNVEFGMSSDGTIFVSNEIEPKSIGILVGFKPA